MESNVKIERSDDGKFLLIEVEYPGRALPGQFFTLKTKNGPYIPRPFSVYDLEGGVMKFLIKAGGETESFLEESKTVVIDGPFGNPIPEMDSPLLIAGGAGYAPIHFYAKCHPYEEMIVGARDKSFFDVVDVPGSSICVVDPILPFDVARYSKNENILLCGPHFMMEGAYEIFGGKNLRFVMEEKMACGRGLCEGCAVMTSDGIKFVCKDGPTFKASEVDLNWAS